MILHTNLLYADDTTLQVHQMFCTNMNNYTTPQEKPYASLLVHDNQSQNIHTPQLTSAICSVKILSECDQAASYRERVGFYILSISKLDTKTT